MAKYYLSSGATISGSDLSSSEITSELKKMGTKIFIGQHRKTHLPAETDLVVYTSAVPPKNPELKMALERKIKIFSYPEAVGELTKKYKTITVSGSHGKSTTTAMLGLALIEGYFDPTVIIGTKVKEFNMSNFRKGWGQYLVLEADEWNKSFLNYSPQIAIITNIDAEHLDTYKNLQDVEKTFLSYLARVPKNGIVIANADDPSVKKIAGKLKRKVVWYSLENPEAAILRRVLKIPGEHNISNALAALKASRALGCSQPDILRALSHFSGAWRRFELKGLLNGAFVFTDYGHHPSEIRSTLKAARHRFPFRRLWCVYQPHQYQRLHYLWKDFIEAFDLADLLLLLPVYDVAGRENPEAKKAVDSKKLAKEIEQRGKNVIYANSFGKAKKLLHSGVRRGDVILIMGAGDIYDFVQDLMKK